MWYKFFGIWIIFGLRTFIGKYKATGHNKKKISGPIIFIANHQNAFIDPLVVMVEIYRYYEVGFMVRQDVFNNKFAAAFLRSLKLFPAYRIRDGFKNLDRNKESFDYAHQRFLKGNGVIIFAEGSHAQEKRLRPIKKGAVRMAFDSLKRDYDLLDLKIIPVGLNYSDATKFGSEVYVNFGEPIDPKAYFKADPKEEKQAIVELNKVLQSELSKLMIDIKNLNEYEEIHYLKDLYISEQGLRKIDLKEKFLAERKAVEQASAFAKTDSWDQIKKSVNEIKTYLNEHDLRDHVLSSANTVKGISQKWFIIALLFPLAFVGILVNFWPSKVSRYVATSKIQDPGFVSSVYFGLGIILFSLWYYVLTIVLCLTLPIWWLGLFAIPVCYLLGQVAIYWLKQQKKLRKIISLKKLIKTNKGINAMIKKRKEIYETVFTHS